MTDDDERHTAEEVLSTVQADIAEVGFCTGIIVIAEVVGGEGEPMLMWRRDTKTSGPWKHIGMLEETIGDLRANWEAMTTDED